MVASNRAFVKSGTYNVAAAITAAQNVASLGTSMPTTIIGYAATRGDITASSANQASRPTIQASAAARAVRAEHHHDRELA